MATFPPAAGWRGRVAGWGGPRGWATFPPGRGVGRWGGSGGERRLPPGMCVRATISCPQNREQSIFSFEKEPILTAWTHFFSLFDALYLRNGCPPDKSEQREWGKGGGMGICLQAID